MIRLWKRYLIWTVVVSVTLGALFLSDASLGKTGTTATAIAQCQSVTGRLAQSGLPGRARIGDGQSRGHDPPDRSGIRAELRAEHKRS